MKTDIYNQNGEKIGDIDLPKQIFEVPFNSDLVHQVAVSQMANKRQVSAHTKTRGEVRGGGKKPWRQKGTGRARHGSIRSPLWRGGGITFGPRNEKVFEKDIPKKMRRKALFMVLSAKAKDKEIFVLDELKLEQAKTKLMNEILKKFIKQSSGLLALPKMDEKIIRAARNIVKVDTIQAKDINVLDLLNYKYLIMPKEAIKVIKETFMKND